MCPLLEVVKVRSFPLMYLESTESEGRRLAFLRRRTEPGKGEGIHLLMLVQSDLTPGMEKSQAKLS